MKHELGMGWGLNDTLIYHFWRWLETNITLPTN